MVRVSDVTELALGVARFSLEEAISHRDIAICGSNVKLAAYCDHVTRNIILRLDALLAVSPIKNKIDIEERWPCDWWQAFRERWFPAWWLRRWPVLYKTISVHREFDTKVCPHLDTSRTPHLKFFLESPKDVTNGEQEG